MVEGLDFGALGTLEAARDGRAIELGGPKQRRLLATLLLRAGHVVSAEDLIDALWQGRPPATALKTIHKYISDLRQKLGDMNAIVTRTQGYVLDLPPLALDVHRFEHLLDEAGQIDDPARRASLLEGALSLWRGVPWADLSDDSSAIADRSRLDERRMAAVEDLEDAELALGLHRRAVGRLEQLVVEYPLRERLWGQLMLALYRSGRQAEALAAYQRLRQILVDELGVEPATELGELEGRILRHDPTLDGAPADSVADSAAGSAALGSPTNLPVPLTRFVGRRRALRDIATLLREARLVTLTGVGGCGKTRLALEAGARETSGHPGGVWLVSLEAITEPEDLPRAIATAIGAREQRDAGLVEVLVDVLKPRPTLIVLDNCEHLIRPCAHLVHTLLRASPDLRVLATSRERLGVAGETVLQVPPLPVPQTAGLPVESLRRHEAIELFVDRASAAWPGFELTDDNSEAVTAICRQLDGIPLALELAATRAGSLGVHEIARRLEDSDRVLGHGSPSAPPRQQTLNAAINWSYALLTDSERELFDRLSVFSGSFTLAQAEEICSGHGIEHPHVVDLLARLVDTSLVARAPESAGAARYRLLETLRQFARANLVRSGDEDRMCTRHALYFVDEAERAETELRGPGQAEWIDRLESEHDNLRSALQYLEVRPDYLLRLAVALWEFWASRGYMSEGLEWLQKGLGSDAHVEPSLRARALAAAGWLALEQSDTKHAEELGERALAINEELRDELGIAIATHLLGWAKPYHGDYARAKELLEESLRRYEAIGQSWYAALALHHLGMLVRLQGDYGQSQALHEQSLELYRQQGDDLRAGFSLWTLGVLARYQGDNAVAINRCNEGLRLLGELRDVSGVAHVKYTLGDLARIEGDYSRAVTLYEESLTGLAKIGDKRCVASTLMGMGKAEGGRSDPERARSLLAGSLSLRQELGDTPGIAECLEGLADLESATGEPAYAVEYLAAAQALRARAGSALPEPDLGELNARKEQLRATVGAETYDRMWADASAQPNEIAAMAAKRLDANTHPSRYA